MGKSCLGNMLIVFLLLSLKATGEQSGQKLYALHCSACHGVDGKGAAGAPFPPLERSEWVQGDARRMISVVLHGLEHPIVVQKKTYNLLMPPQGSVLSDEKIAAISTFVRGNFGNKEKAVEASLVKSVREDTQDRATPWTAPELLMKYPLPPLPLHKLGVRNLVAKVYEGEFETMPDFSQLQPISEEKESGPISLSHAGGRTQNFAIVWEGTIECPGSWDGNFFVSSVGGMRLFYNDQLVFQLKGQGEHYRHTSARTGGTIKGTNTFRLEYFKKGPKGGISLYRSGGSMGYHPLTDTYRDPKSAAYPDLFLAPENGKAAIYRNTIEGMSPRAIAIGLEGGVNYGFSASTVSLELLWRGKFINAGQHWTHRGGGATKPAGESVTSLGRGPGIAMLNDSKTWPSQFDESWKVKFQGYDLDRGNRPTFRYQIAGCSLEDTLGESHNGPFSMARRIKITIPKDASTEKLALRLSSDQSLVRNDQSFLINDTIRLRSMTPERLKQDDKLLYLDLGNLQAGTHQFELNYQWTK